MLCLPSVGVGIIGCASEETGVRHASCTPDGNSFGRNRPTCARLVICGGCAQTVRRRPFFSTVFFRVRVESNPHVRVQRLPIYTFVLTDVHSGSARGSYCTSLCFLCLRLALSCWTCPERLVIIIINRMEEDMTHHQMTIIKRVFLMKTFANESELQQRMFLNSSRLTSYADPMLIGSLATSGEKGKRTRETLLESCFKCDKKSPFREVVAIAWPTNKSRNQGLKGAHAFTVCAC